MDTFTEVIISTVSSSSIPFIVISGFFVSCSGGVSPVPSSLEEQLKKRKNKVGTIRY
jgi:hypothetical protein